MTVPWLAWYLTAVLVLSFLVSSLISYAPPARNFAILEQGIIACAALVAGVIASLLTLLPRTHWVHRSKPIKVLYVTLCVAGTVVLLIFAGA